MKTLITTILMSAFALTASAQKPDQNFYIFLCFGQSNMEGAQDQRHRTSPVLDRDSC